jgi:hypothetical protein
VGPLLAALFDRLEAAWEGARMRRAVATLLLAIFGVGLVTIDLARRGLLPAGVAAQVPTNHFRAVELAFWCLLAFEVVGLVLALARSVANAAGKQFEIFSLILLRHSFEEFGHMPEPIVWAEARGVVVHMLVNGFGALAVFVVLGFYYRLQRHRALTHDVADTRRFVVAKKVIALALLAIFAWVAVGAAASEDHHFFETFFTVLVFADVLIVLLSLRYSGSYHVVFRNSGLAVATVLLRLALSAPAYYNAALGVTAALFALGLTVAYNRLGPAILAASDHEARKARLAG